MAAKKKGSKGRRVKIEIDSATLEALLSAAEALGKIAVAVRASADDVSSKKKKGAKKRR